MKDAAAASATDAQISGELCKTAIAVTKHRTKYTLQVKNAFPIPIYLKKKVISLSCLFTVVLSAT